MAKLPVEIINLLSNESSALSFAITEANAIQNEVSYILLDSNYSDAMRFHVRKDTHTGTFFDALIAKKREWRGFHPFIITVVDCVIHSDKFNNLFGTRRAKNGLAIITEANVPGLIIPPDKMEAYYLYELAVHTLALIVSGKRYHAESRGCIFDLKENKLAILDCIQAGTICDPCKQWFLENGTSLAPGQLNAIDHMLKRSAELLEKGIEPTKDAQKPRVFVGSSVEGLRIAQAIQSNLQYDYFVEIWNQNTVFALGSSTLEALECAVRTYDYAVFVFTPDDQIESRDDRKVVPRDNVIFEAGLFIGQLTRYRAFLVQPRGSNIQLPTDLNGITSATYDPDAPVIDASIGPACRKIRLAIQNMS